MTDDHGHSHGEAPDEHRHGAPSAYAHDEAKVIPTESGRLEVSIFEDGVPPRFRIHFFDPAGNSCAPSVNDMITIETDRGGSGLQTFTFESRDGMYLEATDELPEPHEFDAVVSTVHDGHAHSYDLQFKEHDHGHVVPADHAANDAGGHSHGSGEHRHGPGGGNPVIEAMYHLFPWLPGARGHGHAHSAANIDSAMETSAEGIRAVQQSLIVLGLTALAQVIVVVLTGSVALLADTIHNFGDALTAVPLWIAFSLTRRAPSNRYTYGLGRSEDLAGVAIVLIIFISAVVAIYESVDRIIHPHVIGSVGIVFAAGVLGFIGNEIAAVIRIRTGRRIGSAALIADGQHAVIDGYTSLAVAAGAVGVWLGFPLADPIVGILISIAILFIVRDSAVAVFRRVMDAIEPDTVEEIAQVARAVPGVEDVTSVRARWHGHTISVDVLVTVDEDLTIKEAHEILEKVRRELFHKVGRIGSIMIHADPTSRDGTDHHRSTIHHEPALYPQR